MYVSTDGNLRKPVFTRCIVKVFFRQLNFLYVRNEGGNVICPEQLSLKQPLEVKVQSSGDTELNLAAPSLKLLCQANGNTILKGRCEKLDIRNQAHGDFDASQLKAGELSIKNMAYGNVLLHADDTIRITHYGNGYIHYSGNAEVKDVKQYGHGEIRHIKSEVAL